MPKFDSGKVESEFEFKQNLPKTIQVHLNDQVVLTVSKAAGNYILVHKDSWHDKSADQLKSSGEVESRQVREIVVAGSLLTIFKMACGRIGLLPPLEILFVIGSVSPVLFVHIALDFRKERC